MSENNTTIDPVPSGSDLEGSAQPRQNSERGRSDPMGTFPVPSAVVPITPLPHKKFPTIFLFLIPVLTIIAVISIYVLIQARIMYQQTVAVATPAPTPIPSTDPTADWQTYTDPNNVFTFKYPEDWEFGAKNGSYYLIPRSTGNVEKPVIVFNQIINQKKLSIPEYEKELSIEGPSPNIYSAKAIEKETYGVVGYYLEGTGCEPTFCDKFSFAKDKFIYSFVSLYYDIGDEIDPSQRFLFNQILGSFKFIEQQPLRVLP